MASAGPITACCISSTGIPVAEQLDSLEITQHSLARVLKDLIAGGFVEQLAGTDDRRQRLLHLSAKGQALASELIGMQSRRIGRALATTGVEHRDAITRFLAELVDHPRDIASGRSGL